MHIVTLHVQAEQLKLIQVAITVHEKMNNELVKLTNVLDRAAKAKKERKWFQFKKKDRDAKKANDTLKEAGLDTENEEEVNKRNANWDKLENFEKGAKKVGKKIGKGAKKVGSTINDIRTAKQRKIDEENLNTHLGIMNEKTYENNNKDGTPNSWFGKNKNGEYAFSKNNTTGQYTGWEEENIPRDEEGNYKKRKDIGSNESWLLNPEDYI